MKDKTISPTLSWLKTTIILVISLAVVLTVYFVFSLLFKLKVIYISLVGLKIFSFVFIGIMAVMLVMTLVFFGLFSKDIMKKINTTNEIDEEISSVDITDNGDQPDNQKTDIDN